MSSVDVSKRTRERSDDFRRCHQAMVTIIHRAARYQMTHASMLEARDLELFALDAWKRLTAAHRSEVLGMLRGAVEAWHASEAIIWTHVDSATGSPIPADEWKGDRSTIDVSLSLHRWAGSLAPFGCGGKPDARGVS
jgi:hypothetical protein